MDVCWPFSSIRSYLTVTRLSRWSRLIVEKWKQSNAAGNAPATLQQQLLLDRGSYMHPTPTKLMKRGNSCFCPGPITCNSTKMIIILAIVGDGYLPLTTINGEKFTVEFVRGRRCACRSVKPTGKPLLREVGGRAMSIVPFHSGTRPIYSMLDSA